MSKEPLDYYNSYFNDFFMYASSNSHSYVIADIKPAYALLLESMQVDDKYLLDFIKGASFNIHYEKAKKLHGFLNSVVLHAPTFFDSYSLAYWTNVVYPHPSIK
jgi:hypothetical protein